MVFRMVGFKQAPQFSGANMGRAAPKPSPAGGNDYEAQRAARIAANKQRLQVRDASINPNDQLVISVPTPCAVL